ncbi:MAG TPA: hypothetical protein VFH47_04725 [Candidatus Thermoplasmatota archaeon]|nr:hypothetical protein [Candidatus Thermoplasmatota archaeon]
MLVASCSVCSRLGTRRFLDMHLDWATQLVCAGTLHPAVAWELEPARHGVVMPPPPSAVAEAAPAPAVAAAAAKPAPAATAPRAPRAPRSNAFTKPAV